MENDDPFIVRVGMFFLVLGIGAFILFVLSDIAEQPDFDFLFVALLLIAVGWWMRRNKAQRAPSGRFSGARGLYNRWFRRGGGGKSDSKE